MELYGAHSITSILSNVERNFLMVSVSDHLIAKQNHFLTSGWYQFKNFEFLYLYEFGFGV